MAVKVDHTRWTQQYWFVDGLPELWLGVYGLLTSGLMMAEHYAGNSLWGMLVWLAFMLLNLSTLPARPLINNLKFRLTYPRTGYVEYPSELTPQQWKRVLLVGGVLGVAVMVFVAASFPMLRGATAPRWNIELQSAWMLLLTAAISGLMCLCGWYCSVSRFYIVAATAACAGLCVSLLGLGGYAGAAAITATTSVAVSISGALTLRRYLERTREMEQAHDEA